MTALDKKTILYIYHGDVTDSTGPSVNEREFLCGLGSIGIEFTAILPKPKLKIDRAIEKNAKFSGIAKTSVFWQSTISQSIVMIEALKSIKKIGVHSCQMVVRLPVFPWSLALILLIRPQVAMHVKSLGDTEFLRRVTGSKRFFYMPLANIQSYLVRFVLRRAKSVDTVTEKLARLIVETYQLDEQRICVVPNAANTERFYPLYEQTKECTNGAPSFVIGYVGGSPYVRGGKQIVEVVSRLSSLIPNIECKIAGGDVTQLERIAMDMGVEDRCSIVGKIRYTDVNEFLNSIDLLFATDDLERAKIVGNSNQKIRQALSVGLPVISNALVESDLVELRFVTAVDTDDIDAICTAVKKIYSMSNPEKQMFACKARSYVLEHYSIESTTRKRLNAWFDSV